MSAKELSMLAGIIQLLAELRGHSYSYVVSALRKEGIISAKEREDLDAFFEG